MNGSVACLPQAYYSFNKGKNDWPLKTKGKEKNKRLMGMDHGEMAT